MANLAQIQSIAQGQFFVKDSLGNLTELKVGDTVSLNDTIVAASSNTDLSKIEILFDTNELITLSQGEQLLDTTLLASTFGNEELAFDKQEVDETLNAWNNTEAGDATDMETAAGDVTEQATNAGDENAQDGGALRSKFNSRDGDATDIVSDLREASWTGGIERTIEDSENMLLEDPLPVVYTIEDSENMLLEDPLPVVYTIIEGIDVVNEGDSANYVVKLQDAAGNPVIATQDTIIYVRYTNKTTQDGDTQYNNENIIEVVIKAGTSQTEFTIKTNDDYLADNGEIYNVSITGNNSTEFDMRTGDVAGNKTNVDTTIKDNPADSMKPDTGTGNDDPANGSYGKEDTVYVKISQPSETLEGGKLSHTVTLVDKDGKPVTIPAGEKIIVTLTYTSTDGVTDGDFSTIVKEVELVSNGTTFENTTIVDNTYEGSENYTVTITDVKQTNGTYENVAIHQTENSTTGKITDNPVEIVLVATDSTETIPLKADGTVDLEANKNSTPEGGKLYYVAVAIDSNGKLLDKQTGTVDVSYNNTADTTDKDATLNGTGKDIKNNLTVVEIGKTFTVDAEDDYYAEGDEKFNVTISNPKDTGYDTGVSVKSGADTVTSTIKDNVPVKNHQVDGTGGIDGTVYGKEDTVYAVITPNTTSVVEGGEVTYTVKLVDSTGKEVKVTSDTKVTVTFGTNNSVSDGEVELKGTPNNNPLENGENITITIPKNGNSASFTIKTKDDFAADNDETFNLKITDIDSKEFENIVYDDKNGINTTIKDGVTLGTPKNAYVDEDNFYKNDFNNTDSSSEYTTKNISNFDNKTGHIKGDLGIIAPIEDNGYTLSFDNTINVYKGNENATETNIYGDGTALKSGGNEIKYKLVGTDKIVAYTGTEANYDKNKVFEITLEKDNNGKYTGDYKYTQYKNIDHPIDGDDKSINDDDITFEFGFKISDQGSTSSVQTFKVTVNDSSPIAGEQNLVVYEDSSLQFIISDEGFKGNTIEISNDGGNKYKTLTTTNGSNSIDILENGQKIGTLTNKGDGKLEFKPAEDYSKYTNDNLPNFKYKVYDTDGDYAEGTVNIKVKPVVDGTKIEKSDVNIYEDAGNDKEGTNIAKLNSILPTIKDNTDKNDGATGDHGERVGDLTFKFTNGQYLKGAKLVDKDGNAIKDKAGNEIVISTNKTIKFVIINEDDSLNKDFHHSDVSLTEKNTVYLTKEQYENLHIIHAEDNDTDIVIEVRTKTYEVDDNGKSLTTSQANNQGKYDKNTITVWIKPVTDAIELKFDSDKLAGSIVGEIKEDGKLFVFNKDIIKEEGTINFKELLTNTSGTKDTNGHQGTGGDLDGSEIRWYTVKFEGDSKDHPDYLIINGKTVYSKNGEYKYEFTTSENTKEDPDFKVQFPNGYSGGTLKGELTLHVQDRGVEEKSDPTKWGDELKQTVKFEVAVNPVADDATVKVGQPVGYEDAGRTSLDEDGKYDKNIQDKDGTIKHPENGIKLPIEVTSTDKDNSETFTVTIKDIPNGGAIFVKEPPLTGKDILVTYAQDGTPTIKVWNNGILEDYNGTAIKAEKGSITIEKYDNANPPKFIPPHNEHGDFKLNVDAKTVDTVKINGVDKTYTQEVATSKEIVVVVKDVADSVVGNKYETEDLSADTNYKKPDERKDSIFNKVVDETDAETNGISLNSIFTVSTKPSSYDKESEDLTIIIRDLPIGVTLTGNVTLINGQYIFKADDISDIKIVTPPNYSGELNFKIDYITTEKGEVVNGEDNPSKTFDSKTSPEDEDKVSIFVKPTVDAVFKSNTTKEEDIKAEKVDGEANSYYKLDLGISHKNEDTDETLVSVTINEPTSSEYKLFIKNGDNFEAITFTNGKADIALEDLVKVYVQAPENKHGDFNLSGSFVAKDSQNGLGNSINYETTKEQDFTHTLTITPVTDTPTIEVESGTQTHINVNAGENTEIKIPVKVSSGDKDGSENITKIVISGVPQGVTVDGLTNGQVFENGNFINVSIHNGIYTITGHNLNSDSFKDIVFNVGANADFEHRDITITAYTKDAQGSTEEQTSTKITLDKIHNGNGGGTGTGPKLDIVVDETKKDFKATEDTQFNFLDAFKVTVADNSNDGRTELNFKIDVGSNATLKGLDAYKNADGSYTIKGNRADIESVLANLKVVPNKDFNSNQDADGISIKVETNGKESTIKVPVTPVTDSLNVEITANDNTTIDENGEFNFDIKLTNNSDKEFTIINDFYVVIDEKFEAGENAKGELYLGNTKLELVDGKYKLPADYKLGDSLNLTYKSGEDRNGTVEIKVVALNKETGATNELSSAGSTTITVKPVVSSVIEVQKVQDGIEDQEMASAKLNVVKADPSEKFESVLIKEVASGVAVYYNGGNSLAMNVGDGSWIVPVNSDGTLPQIFFKGSEHLAGNIGFKATINVKDGESKVTTTLKGSVYIEEVADGVTIDPTKTGIDKNAFEWTTLNLNANMKDLDGSEKMYLELKGLGAFAQFKLKDGGIVESEYDSVNKVWTIKDIAYDKINDIQFTNDKDTTVDIKAWTTDGIDSTREKPATGFMEVDFAKNAVENGKFTLGKEVNIDFSKIVNGDIQGVNKIDLSAEGENKLLNLTLDDVLSIGKKDGSGNINLDILGGTDDKVSFKDNDGWELKTENIGKVEGDKTFDVYTNSGDSTVQVKVEQPISDGITN